MWIKTLTYNDLAFTTSRTGYTASLPYRRGRRDKFQVSCLTAHNLKEARIRATPFPAIRQSTPDPAAQAPGGLTSRVRKVSNLRTFPYPVALCRGSEFG